MPNAKLDTDGLVNELNYLRKQGRIVNNRFRIGGLQRRIDAIKRTNFVVGEAYQASLWCLTGDVEAMLDSGTKVMQQDLDGALSMHHVVNLVNAGLYSLAWEQFHQIDELLLKDDVIVATQGFGCFAFAKLSSIFKVINVDRKDIVMTVAEASAILQENGVGEKDVVRMLDIAGDVLRNHGLLQCGEPAIFAYPSHSSMTISIPVNLSPEEVAELEWEFARRLFAEIPDAPAHIAQIGFCVGA